MDRYENQEFSPRSYSDGYEPLMDAFLRNTEGVSARVPTMFVVGNHEVG